MSDKPAALETSPPEVLTPQASLLNDKPVGFLALLEAAAILESALLNSEPANVEIMAEQAVRVLTPRLVVDAFGREYANSNEEDFSRFEDGLKSQLLEALAQTKDDEILYFSLLAKDMKIS